MDLAEADGIWVFDGVRNFCSGLVRLARRTCMIPGPEVRTRFVMEPPSL